MNILVFGTQGSGKSTYAKYVAEKLGVPYVYTGDLFRQLEKEDSRRGKIIRGLMKKGVIIPNKMSISAFKEYLEKFDLSGGVVLDGYPRNLAQAESLPIKLDLIINVYLSEKEAIERLLSRGRDDDSRGAIKKRLELFEKQTQPILTYYKNKGVEVIEVDNTPPVEIVKKTIDDLLKKQSRN